MTGESKKKKHLSVRDKAFLSTLLLGMVMFFILSPLSGYAKEAIFAPVKVKNVTVVQKDSEIQLTWDANDDYDINEYQIVLIAADNVNVYDQKTKNTNTVISNLENNKEYRLQINAIDKFNQKSRSISTNILLSPDEINSIKLNTKPAIPSLYNEILKIALPLFIITLLLSLWVFGYQIKKGSIVPIAAFPSVTLLSPIFLAISVLLTISLDKNKFIFSGIVTVILTVVSYFLFLTANILNTSTYSRIPLEQAGKAAQFIFGLISAYLMMIFVFGNNIDFLLRIITIVPTIYYFTYSLNLSLRGISVGQVFMRSIAITMVMSIALIIFSIWPVNYIYAMLSSAVIFYILLSVSLEVRVNLTRYIWIEYFTLVFLVTFLLFANSSWGINGPII